MSLSAVRAQAKGLIDRLRTLFQRQPPDLVDGDSSTDFVITIHGTGDGVGSKSQPKWWQPTSSFVSQLCGDREMTGRTIHPFRWSGANSDRERQKAAKHLAATIESVVGLGVERVHLIAHSHGANVAVQALAFLRPVTVSRIHSCVAMGAPWLLRSLSVPGRSIVWTLRALAIILVAATPIALWLYANPFNDWTSRGDAGLVSDFDLLMIRMKFYPLSLIVASVLLFAAHRMSSIEHRAIRCARAGPVWANIHFANDEAVGLLDALKYIDAKPISETSVRSGLRLPVLIASLVVGLSAAAWASGELYSAFMENYPYADASLWRRITTISGPVLAEVLTGAPLIFLGAVVAGLVGYAILTWFVVPILASLLAWVGNRFVVGALKGAALGQDGLFRLEMVGPDPSKLGVRTTDIAFELSASDKSELERQLLIFAADARSALGVAANVRMGAVKDELWARLNAAFLHNLYLRHPRVVAEVGGLIFGVR